MAIHTAQFDQPNPADGHGWGSNAGILEPMWTYDINVQLFLECTVEEVDEQTDNDSKDEQV